MVIRQGDVWWADLDDPDRSSPGFRRPVVVIQSNAFNASRISTVICVALTSNLKWADAPGNVLLKSCDTGLDRDSVANVSAVVTIDKAQLTESTGMLSEKLVSKIFLGLDLVLGR